MFRKLLSLALCLCMALTLTSAVAEGTSFTVTDMTGREVELAAPAQRIVALTPSDCEILYAIGASDLLVGRSTYCDYPAEVSELPVVASGADTNV